MENDSFNETNELIEIFSILEANDEQLRCIWKKIENQTIMVKALQSQIICNDKHQVKYDEKLSSQADMLIERQNDKIEKEIVLIYERIIGGEQVTSFMLIIMSILLVSVFIQHYDLGNVSNYNVYRQFALNSSEL
jgi:hypothetical protein